MNEKQTCNTCKHYKQHYIKIGNNYYTPIAYGHCGYPRLKKRDSNTPACDNYKERKDQAS